MQSLISLWFVVQLHQKGGQTPSLAPGILLCHNRWEVCRPQALYWATWARKVGHHTFLKTVVAIQSSSWFTGHIQHFSSHRQKQQRFNFLLSEYGCRKGSCMFYRYYQVVSVRYCHCAARCGSNVLLINRSTTMNPKTHTLRHRSVCGFVLQYAFMFFAVRMTKSWIRAVYPFRISFR